MSHTGKVDFYRGFPHSSAGKESACSTGDPSSIAGSERPLIRVRLPTPTLLGLPCGSAGKESACNAGDLGSILGWEDPLEKEMATHSSILAWRIPWTEEPGGLKTKTVLEHCM